MSAFTSQLHLIPNSIELYHGHHRDTYPTLLQIHPPDFDVLINSTDVNGDTTGSDFGSYLHKMPRNPFQALPSTGVVSDNTAYWQNDKSTGDIRGSVDAAFASDLGLEATDFIVE